MQRELPRWIFIAFLPTSSFSWPTVPPTWPPPHPRPLLRPEINATHFHLINTLAVARELHRDSERQLHFDSKFEHEEMVLVA